jgi:hypothetical protein
VSTDGGQSWRNAILGQDYGRFSFRSWSYPINAADRGSLTVMAKASNRAGATQTFELIANPAGYHHNVVQRIALAIG